MNESEHEQNVNWCAAERTLELLAHEMKSRPGGTVGDSQGDPPPPRNSRARKCNVSYHRVLVKLAKAFQYFRRTYLCELTQSTSNFANAFQFIRCTCRARHTRELRTVSTVGRQDQRPGEGHSGSCNGIVVF